MFTRQRERDVSVGMDSEIVLWYHPGPTLAVRMRDLQKRIDKEFILLYMQPSFRDSTDCVACR